MVGSATSTINIAEMANGTLMVIVYRNLETYTYIYIYIYIYFDEALDTMLHFYNNNVKNIKYLLS